MQLKSTYKWFTRIGLLLIGLAGFVFAIGDSFIPQDAAMLQAMERPQDFAELVTGEGFHIWAMRGLFGAPMETIGVIALFLDSSVPNGKNWLSGAWCSASSGISSERACSS